MKTTQKISQGLRSLSLAGAVYASSVAGQLQAQDSESQVRPADNMNQISQQGKDLARATDNTKSVQIKDFYADLGAHSKYLGTFGFSITKDPVVTADLGFNIYIPFLQGVNDRTSKLEIGPLAYNLWGNYDPNNGLSELDNNLSMEFKTKNFIVRPEFYQFNFPSSGAPSACSLNLGVSTRNLPVNVGLYGVQAFGKVSQGRLFQLILTKQIKVPKLSEKLTIGLEGRVTHNNHYFIQGSGFSTAWAGVNATYNFGKGISATLGVRGQKVINSLDAFQDDYAIDFNLHKNF